MDIKNIKLLAKIMSESDLSALEVLDGESKVRLERTNTVSSEYSMPAVAPKVEKTIVPVKTIEESGIDFNNVTEVKSPMIGLFYSSPSPSDPPFVRVGSKVNKGDTLCIIEAMKIMNEITAEVSGEVVDICVSNGQLVEFSQTLFKIF